MRKITLLIVLLTTIFAFGQTPTTAAPVPPTRDVADVISIFSQTSDENTTVYDDIDANLNPDWGSTSGNVSFPEINGDRAMFLPTFSYQGIDFDGNRQNVSGFEKVHIDIWTNNVNAGFYLIWAGGEVKVDITSSAGMWQSLDFNLTDFTGVDLTTIRQIKFDGGNGTTDEIYIDNLYFWKTSTPSDSDATLSDLKVNGVTINGFSPSTENYTYEVPPGDPVPTISATTSQTGASEVITQANAVPGDATVVVTSEDASTIKTYTVSFIVDPSPTAAAPTPPSFAASNVISLYSDAFTDVNSNFDAGWCGGSSVQEVSIAGNNTMKYLLNACQGIDFAGDRRNAINFNRVHIDFYTSETNLTGKVFNLKLVDFGDAGGNTEIRNVEVNINTGTTPAITTGSWISVDAAVDLSNFTGLAQAAITSNLNGTVWYDNFYIYVDGTANTDDNSLFESRVYPNPSSDRWTISTPNNIINSVEVFNVLGKKVIYQSFNSDEVSISVQSLASGIYLARLTTNAGVKTMKLIRE